MQDEQLAQLSDEQIDNIVLSFMLEEHQWPWSLDEIGLELGSKARATDAVARLIGTGLLHRWGDMVFPTRAAARAADIEIGTV